MYLTQIHRCLLLVCVIANCKKQKTQYWGETQNICVTVSTCQATSVAHHPSPLTRLATRVDHKLTLLH
jgi:hypothetical protein